MSPTSSNFSIFSTLRYDPLLLHKNKNDLCSDDESNGSPFYMLPYHRDRMMEAAEFFGWHAAVVKLTDFECLLETLIMKIEAFELGRHDKLVPFGPLNQVYFDGNDHSKSLRLPQKPLKFRISMGHTGALAVEITPIPGVLTSHLIPTAEFLDQWHNHSILRLPDQQYTPKDIRPTYLSNKTLPLEPGSNPNIIPFLATDASDISTDPWNITIDSVSTPTTPFTRFKTTSRTVYTAARARANIPSFSSPAEVLLHNKEGEITEGSLTSVYFWRDRHGNPWRAGSDSEQGRWVTPPLESGGQQGTTRRWLLKRGLCWEQTVRADSLMHGECVWLSNGVRGMIRGLVDLKRQ